MSIKLSPKQSNHPIEWFRARVKHRVELISGYNSPVFIQIVNQHHAALLFKMQNDGIVAVNQTGDFSCNHSCSPSDHHIYGKCDKMGCFSRNIVDRQPTEWPDDDLKGVL